MKRITLLLLSILLAYGTAGAQTTAYLRNDTIKLTNAAKNTTLVIESASRGHNWYLKDIGNGRTQFVEATIGDISHLQDSLIEKANDNTVVHKAGDRMLGSLINNESVSIGANGYTQIGISPNVAAHQGVADDGTYYYIVATTSIKKYDHSWNLIATRSDPFTRNASMVHLGPPYVLGGKLYTNVEDQNGYDLKPTGIQEVWTYNTSDLTEDAIITNTKFSELQVGAALCINADTLYMAAFATDVVARIKLSTNTFINSFHTGVLGMQGIRVLPDGHLIVSSASGFFRMNRTDGSNLAMVKAIKPGDGVVEGIEIQGSNLLYLRDVSNNGTESYVVTLSPTGTPQAFYTDKTGAANVGGNLQVGGYGLFMNPIGILTQNYKGSVNASSGDYNKINLEQSGSKVATGISSNADRVGLVYNYHSMFASNDIVDDSTKYAAQVRIENDNKRFGFFSGLITASNATTPRFTVAFDTGLATFFGNLIPITNNTLTVGSSTNYFNNGYFTTGTVKTLNSNDLEVTPTATIRAMRFTTTEGTNWDLIPTTSGNGSGTDKLVITANASTTTGANFTINKTTGAIGLFGISSPTAFLGIPGSTTSTASYRVLPGAAPTSPNSGEFWNTGPTLKMYTSNSVIRRFAVYPDVAPTAGKVLNSNGTDFDLTSSPTLIQSSANSVLNLTNNTQTNTWSVYSTGGFNAAGSGRYSITNTGSPSTAAFTIDSLGRIGAFGVSNPTSYFDFPGASVSYGSLRIRTMSAQPTSPNEGTLINTGANLEVYLNSNWNKLIMTQETTPNPGQMLMYNTNTNRYDPITPAGNSGIVLVYASNGTSLTFKNDTAAIQTVSNFFPKGDTRYARLAAGNTWGFNQTFTSSILAKSTVNLYDTGGINAVSLSVPTSLASGRSISFPDANGTLALKSDITAASVNPYSTSSTPSIVLGASNIVGTGATISIAGNNQDGVITLVTGTSVTGIGGLFTVTNSNGFAYPTTCVPVLQGANATTSGIVANITCPSSTTTSWDVSTNAVLAASTTYKWNYHNGGY